MHVVYTNGPELWRAGLRSIFAEDRCYTLATNYGKQLHTFNI